MSAKRYISILLSVLLLSVFAYLLPDLVYSFSTAKVTLTPPSLVSSYDRIPLSGTVTAADSSDLICKLPLIPSKVCVSVGDSVTAGQTVALIDKEQTLYAITSLLTALNSFSELKSALSSYADMDSFSSLKDLNSAIPTRLTSPAAGTVLSSNLKTGSMITPGISCMTVAGCETLYATLTADEANAEKLESGDTVYLRSTASEDRVLTASVTDIAPVATQVLSGSSLKTVVEITAALPENAGLKPGYSVYGYCFSDTPDEYLIIPLGAVFQQDETEYVYLWENGRAVLQKIGTDGIYAGNAIVTDGLTGSDIVILSDQLSEIRSGDRVTVIQEEDDE